VSPLPDALQKFLPTEIVARQFLFFEFALDDELRGDASVIFAGNPERAEAAHALETREHVHQGVLEGVPHVERAGHVRRRDDDGIDGRVRVAVDFGREAALRFPVRVVSFFSLFRIVCLRNFHGIKKLLAISY
jgi:hypothetical protein